MKLGIVIWSLLLAAPGVFAAGPTTAPTTRAAPALVPSITPGAALLASMQATVDADEAKYRQVVDLKSPDDYSEAYTRWVFASARIHQAIADQHVTAEKRTGVGFDRNAALAPNIPAPPARTQWDAIRKAVQAIEWEVNGNTARPKGDAPLLDGSTAGKMSVERSGDGWIVVLADPTDSTPPEQLKELAKDWSVMAKAIDSATEQVKAGKLKTIRAVNDFVDAELKKDERAK